VAEVVGKKSALDAVETGSKALVAVRPRGEGVGARHLLVAILRQHRDELTGGEVKVRQLLDFKLEVLALGALGEQHRVQESGCIDGTLRQVWMSAFLFFLFYTARLPVRPPISCRMRPCARRKCLAKNAAIFNPASS